MIKMDKVVFTNITIDELKLLFQESISNVIQNSASEDSLPNTNIELLSRRDAANFLGISLPTLHNWTMKGVIKGYRINTNVKYKKCELEKALIAIKTAI